MHFKLPKILIPPSLFIFIFFKEIFPPSDNNRRSGVKPIKRRLLIQLPCSLVNFWSLCEKIKNKKKFIMPNSLDREKGGDIWKLLNWKWVRKLLRRSPVFISREFFFYCCWFFPLRIFVWWGNIKMPTSYYHSFFFFRF